jgi:hypothetical protein
MAPDTSSQSKIPLPLPRLDLPPLRPEERKAFLDGSHPNVFSDNLKVGDEVNIVLASRVVEVAQTPEGELVALDLFELLMQSRIPQPMVIWVPRNVIRSRHTDVDGEEFKADGV